jgi:Carboxylesterase family
MFPDVCFRGQSRHCDSACAVAAGLAHSAMPVTSYLAFGSPNKPRSIVARPAIQFLRLEKSMRTFMPSAKGSRAAAFAAIFLTGARAADSLRIEGGQIAGAVPDASGIRVFNGIPHAAPPVGELRWKVPQPVQPWNGIRSIAGMGPALRPE